MVACTVSALSPKSDTPAPCDLEARAVSAERFLALRDRQVETTRRMWVRAAEAALTALPGASCSTHPAHDLWLRVEMAKLGPVEIIHSTETPPLSSGGEAD